MKCSEVVAKMENLCPKEAALEWDNPGLLVGDFDSTVHSVMIALDATSEVIDAAVSQRVDMLITHHPLIFGKINSVNSGDITGRRILKLIKNGINYYAAHTNFDTKIMGTLAASMLGIDNHQPLEVTGVNSENGQSEGIGIVADVYESPAKVWLDKVKASFELDNIIVFGDESKIIKRIAVSPGSGKSMISEAIDKKADLLITGDIGHHEGIDAIEEGIIVADAGHYGLEYIFIDYVAKYLERECQDVRIMTCKAGIPFKII